MSILTNNTFFDVNNLLGSFYSTNTLPRRRSHIRRPVTATWKHSSSTLQPKVDIIKQDNGYRLIAELPGISKEQLNITVEEAVLTIETSPATVEQNEQEKKVEPQYLHRECHSGNFRRSFDLGQDTELSDITANFKNGLLTLDIPKQKHEVPASRRIDIH